MLEHNRKSFGKNSLSESQVASIVAIIQNVTRLFRVSTIVASMQQQQQVLAKAGAVIVIPSVQG